MPAASKPKRAKRSKLKDAKKPPLVANPKQGSWQEVICELLLLGLALMTLWNAGSVFSESLLQQDLVLLTCLIHVAWSVSRRLRVPLALAFVGIGAFTVAGFTFLRYRDSSARLPADAEASGSVWDQITADWDVTISVLREEIVPLPLNTGFLFLTAIMMFLLASLGDWAAFRVRVSSADGVLGYTCIFIATMLFRDGGQRVLAAFLYAALVLAFVLFHRVFSNRRRIPLSLPVLLSTGFLVVALALGAGVVGATSLSPDGKPFRIDLSTLQIEQQGGSSNRKVLNPLVEIQSQLVTQSNDKLFTVLADEPQYWRVTSLDDFDGGSWTSAYTYRSASGKLDPGISSGTSQDSKVVDQLYTLFDFSSAWVPAAFDVERVHNFTGNVGLLYDSDSSTLLVDSEAPTVNGLIYTVRSQVPTYDTAQLEQVTFAAYSEPENLADAVKYTQLPKSPEELSPTAYRVAQEVTAHAETPFGKALALQNWLRSDFTYNLDVERGHSIDRVEDFLEIRQGYCEQFASTFAMMARMLGIPTRVVIGFTWGEPVELDHALEGDFQNFSVSNPPSQAYEVYGRHYHSWAEVLIPGAGWVLMEPTPSRGPPDSSHTQVERDQHQLTPPATVPEAEASTTVPTGDSNDPEGVPPTVAPAEPGQPAGSDSPAGNIFASAADAWTLIGLFLLGVALLWALVFPARGAWFWRRIQDSATERTLLAWQRAQLAWQRAGVPCHSTTTSHEFAALVAEQSGLTRNPLAQLADRAAAASYGAVSPDAAEAAVAEELSRLARQQAVLRIPKWKRLLGFGVTSPYWLGGRPRQ